MKAYMFSIIMFLLSILFISAPMLSAALLGSMAFMLAIFSFMVQRQLRAAPVVVREVHIRDWDSWT